MLDLEDLIDEFYIFKLLLLRICNNVGYESSKYPISALLPRLIDCNCGRSIEMNEYRNEN